MTSPRSIREHRTHRRLVQTALAAILLAGPAAADEDPVALFRTACLATLPDFARLPAAIPGRLAPTDAPARTRHILQPSAVEMWEGGALAVQRVRGRVGPYGATGCAVLGKQLTRAAMEAVAGDAEFIYEAASSVLGDQRTYLVARTWGGDRYALLSIVWFPGRGGVLVLEAIDFGDVDPSADAPVDTDGLVDALMGMLRDRRLRT